MSYQTTLEQFEKWLEKKMPETWMTLKLVRHWKEKFYFDEDEEDSCELCMNYNICPAPIALCSRYKRLNFFTDSHSSLPTPNEVER